MRYLACLSILLCFHAAHAGRLPGSEFSAGTWQGFAETDEKGQFAGCVVTGPRSPSNQSALLFIVDDDGRFLAGMVQPTATFSNEALSEGQLRVDNHPPRRIRSAAISPTTRAAVLEDEARTRLLLQEGSYVELQFAASGPMHRFSLKGSYRAISALYQCAARFNPDIQLPSAVIAKHNTPVSERMPQGTSYVAADPLFAAIEDVKDEARAWAGCAAVYDLAAEIYDSASGSPAQAEEMRQMANGAEVAVMMSLLSDVVKDMNLESGDVEAIGNRVNAVLSYAKTAMTEWPNVQRTRMEADGERLRSLKDGELQYTANLIETVKVCLQNAPIQQMYIDLMRELTMSGLFSPVE